MSKDHKNWASRHKLLTIVGVIAVIAIIASATGGGTSTDNSTNNGNQTNNSAQADTSNTSSTAKIGEPARDGKFEFTVQSVECGKTSVGTNEYLTKKAQGQFCLLKLTVKNIGDEKQSLFSSNQKLFNAAGQEYSADDTATMYASSDDASTWLNDINPGNSVSGVIVFDLPKDQTPIRAELHDSAFSGGVKVSLK